MSKTQNKATNLIIKISLYVAYIDGNFHNSESKVIKQWIKQRIDDLNKPDADNSAELKKMYKDYFEESKQLAMNGKLKIYSICKELRALKSQPAQIAAMDLAVQIMTADNIIHNKEISTIYKVAKLLGISHDEVMKITNMEILKMTKIPEEIDIEGLLNIDPTVSNKKADKWFNELDDTWHGATTSTNAGMKRKIAQKMYEEVSKAWGKYPVS